MKKSTFNIASLIVTSFIAADISMASQFLTHEEIITRAHNTLDGNISSDLLIAIEDLGVTLVPSFDPATQNIIADAADVVYDYCGGGFNHVNGMETYPSLPRNVLGAMQTNKDQLDSRPSTSNLREAIHTLSDQIGGTRNFVTSLYDTDGHERLEKVSSVLSTSPADDILGQAETRRLALYTFIHNVSIGTPVASGLLRANVTNIGAWDAITPFDSLEKMLSVLL